MYRVVAPYVTLRFMDGLAGKWVLHGLYAGAIVPDSVNTEDIERHLRKGMVAEVEEPAEAKVEEPAKPAPKADEAPKSGPKGKAD